MKLACEYFVKNILPAVRALLARDLLEKYNLTQRETARRLEMTQPAISQYKNKLRGKKVKQLESCKKISEKIDELAEGIARQKMDKEEYDSEICKICKEARKESLIPGKTKRDSPKA